MGNITQVGANGMIGVALDSSKDTPCITDTSQVRHVPDSFTTNQRVLVEYECRMPGAAWERGVAEATVRRITPHGAEVAFRGAPAEMYTTPTTLLTRLAGGEQQQHLPHPAPSSSAPPVDRRASMTSSAADTNSLFGNNSLALVDITGVWARCEMDSQEVEAEGCLVIEHDPHERAVFTSEARRGKRSKPEAVMLDGRFQARNSKRDAIKVKGDTLPSGMVEIYREGKGACVVERYKIIHKELYAGPAEQEVTMERYLEVESTTSDIGSGKLVKKSKILYRFLQEEGEEDGGTPTPTVASSHPASPKGRCGSKTSLLSNNSKSPFDSLCGVAAASSDILIDRLSLIDILGWEYEEDTISEWYDFAHCLTAIVNASYLTITESARQGVSPHLQVASIMKLAAAAQYVPLPPEGYMALKDPPAKKLNTFKDFLRACGLVKKAEEEGVTPTQPRLIPKVSFRNRSESLAEYFRGEAKVESDDEDEGQPEGATTTATTHSNEELKVLRKLYWGLDVSGYPEAESTESSSTLSPTRFFSKMFKRKDAKDAFFPKGERPYENVLIFTRGDAVIKEEVDVDSLTEMKEMFSSVVKKEEDGEEDNHVKETPIYRNVLVVYPKLKVIDPDSPIVQKAKGRVYRCDTHSLVVETYTNVPKSELCLLLPVHDLMLPWFDIIGLLGSAIPALVMFIVGVFTLLAEMQVTLGDDPFRMGSFYNASTEMAMEAATSTSDLLFETFLENASLPFDVPSSEAVVIAVGACLPTGDEVLGAVGLDVDSVVEAASYLLVFKNFSDFAMSYELLPEAFTDGDNLRFLGGKVAEGYEGALGYVFEASSSSENFSSDGLNFTETPTTTEQPHTAEATFILVIVAFLVGCVAKLSGVLGEFLSAKLTLGGMLAEWKAGKKEASGESALLQLASQVVEQEAKECLMAFHLLNRCSVERTVTFRGLSTKATALFTRIGLPKCTLEVTDAFAKLQALGIAVEIPGGAGLPASYRLVTTMKQFLQRRHAKWSGLLTNHFESVIDNRIK